VSDQAAAIVGIAALAIDCHNPPELAGWWSRLPGGAVEVDDIYDGGVWQVLRDPEGNEFCILRPRR
jgi:Glyoxalase-like domain